MSAHGSLEIQAVPLPVTGRNFGSMPLVSLQRPSRIIHADNALSRLSFSGHVTALQGFVAVDGDVFNWVGAASGPSVATQTSAEYTSTKTVFTFDVNSKVTLTATFLSPVYPNDLLKQSLQYSYIDVAVASSDGASHDVQIYLDCTGGELDFLAWPLTRSSS